MANFSLIILEYTSSEDLIACEQKWIDLLNPEYNLSPIAGSSKGYKHLEASIEKIREATLGRRHSEEIRSKMSESRKGKNNSFYGKTHSEEAIALIRAAALNRGKPPVPGISVDVTDLETKLTTTYDSVRKAANAINSDIKTILRREKSQLEKGINTPYRNKYIITIKRS
jgi:group I intron endonuclease